MVEQESNISQATVTRSFYCTVCNELHKIPIKRNLLDNQKEFPFAYIYFHGQEDQILTTLYFDAHLNIRGAESFDLNILESNFLPQKKSNELMQQLAKELANVRKEYKILNQKFNNLMDDYSSLKLDIEILKSLKGIK